MLGDGPGTHKCAHKIQATKQVADRFPCQVKRCVKFYPSKQSLANLARDHHRKDILAAVVIKLPPLATRQQLRANPRPMVVLKGDTPSTMQKAQRQQGFHRQRSQRSRHRWFAGSVFEHTATRQTEAIQDVARALTDVPPSPEVSKPGWSLMMDRPSIQGANISPVTGDPFFRATNACLCPHTSLPPPFGRLSLSTIKIPASLQSEEPQNKGYNTV